MWNKLMSLLLETKEQLVFHVAAVDGIVTT
jgi:hypothetical protein